MWHSLPKEEVIRKLKTNLNFGLSEKEVERRKLNYGENKLAEKKKTNIFLRFIQQFNDFMIITLIFAAIISAIMSYLENSKDYIDSIIIIAIVIFNAILGLVQESKAEKSLEALKKLSSPVAKVRRNRTNYYNRIY